MEGVRPSSASDMLNTFDLNKASSEKSHKRPNGDSFLKSFLERHLPKDGSNKGGGDDLVYETRTLDNAVGKAVKKRRSERGAVKKSCNRIRKLSKFELSPEHQQYSMYLPMHQLWKDYIRSIVKFENLKDHSLKTVYPLLLKADYHGCLIQVIKSKCPSYVDASGIVIQETKNMFRVITKEDKLKSFPKANSIFTFQLDGFKFTLHGNQFRHKSGERVSKQFKVRKLTLDL